ncbi:MAG TPA: HlyD family efflux transporter periplasmic adaptor subunit [Ramlibacter sp.]|jgi:multidrug resistance efflux pump|nr:HlyD family efflux transporter periplasmic adaptor subunit [Ramlibacter sp.]
MISREANLPRKAMRVAIPLFVEIDGKNHAASDWSTTGVGISDLDRVPQDGEMVHARLSFPMLESTLLIPVQLVYRGEHDGVAGFEFHGLSPRNRRILRHYIELSLDGKLGDVDDIVAVAALPAADTPVHGPLTLGGGGAPLPRRGIARAFGAGLLGLGVIAAAAGLVWYNLTYQLEGTGFVAGSIARVTANHDGQVARLLVQPGSRVEANTPLFAVENPQLRNEVEALEQHVAQLGSEQARLAAARRQAEAGLLGAMRRDYTEREGELANARKLFESGVITQRDMMVVADRLQGMRQDYLRQVSESATRTQSIDSSDVINRMRLELAAKKVLLARQEAERVVRAPVRGKVFQVERQAGEFVSPQDAVVLLEADVTPSVWLRVPNDDALKLKMGMPATIYVPSDDRKYSANVSAVGLSAASANAPVTQEGGLNETLVKIDFDDKRVRLPANSRVNVWIRNPSLPWS